MVADPGRSWQVPANANRHDGGRARFRLRAAQQDARGILTSQNPGGTAPRSVNTLPGLPSEHASRRAYGMPPDCIGRGPCRSIDRACDPMPEHDRAADTSRAPDERIDPLRFRRSICMPNEIDVALRLSDRDRLCRVRHHGAARRVRGVHAIAAHPVSVVAAIAPHRRRRRFPIKNAHAKYLRGLPVSRLRHTSRKTSAPHRTFHRRNVGGLPSRACPARTPRDRLPASHGCHASIRSRVTDFPAAA